jgi:hypothetical protein
MIFQGNQDPMGAAKAKAKSKTARVRKSAAPKRARGIPRSTLSDLGTSLRDGATHASRG